MNFNTFNNANIDTANVTSVREMIFKHAQEKANALAEEKKQDVMASVKNDVMQSARVSFANQKTIQFGNLTKEPEESKKVNDSVDKNKQEQNQQPQLKHNIQNVENNVYIQSVQNEIMNSVRNQFTGKSSLNESLKFLNTQAAINTFNKNIFKTN